MSMIMIYDLWVINHVAYPCIFVLLMSLLTLLISEEADDEGYDVFVFYFCSYLIDSIHCGGMILDFGVI